MSSILSDELAAVDAPGPADGPAPRPSVLALTFRGILRAEWIKLRTVRSTRMTCFAALVAVIGLGALAAAVSAGDITAPEGPRHAGGFGSATDPTAISLSGVLLAQLIVAVIGVLAVTNEYGTGMIRAYFAAVPTRLPLLWAKAIVVAVVVTAGSLIAAVVAFLVGQSVLGSGVDLGDPGVVRAVLGAALYLGVISVLGVAVGALLRHTAGSVAVLFATLLIIPQLLVAILPGDWSTAITPYLPSNAGSALMTVSGSDTLLAPAAGAAVLAGWVGLLLVGAAWRMRTTDA
ncbi:ABC transporter permease [Nakamurella silvestris]|nr:ABC transporter permease [Nakamurella silvestris]